MSTPRMEPVRHLLAEAVGPVFPSAQLVVVDRGATVLDEAVACQPQTRFDLASLTKALATTTLAMRLLDDRRLSLDDELRPGVTVRHALAHATGLPAWRPLHEQARARADGEPDDLRRAVIEAAHAEPLEAAPGSRSVYSDLGYILLGDAIERAAGQRLDEAWAAVAERLEVAAGYAPEGDEAARCAPTRRGGDDDEDRPPTDDELLLRGTVNDDNALAMQGVAGHAGLFATAAEVAVIATALVEAWSGRAEHPIARPETVRAFFAPSGVPGSTWCLGWDRPTPLGHGASQAGSSWPRDGVGHLGYTGCSLWIDPARARFVVLLSNRVFQPPSKREAIKAFRPTLHDAILARLDGG